ncbi:unnamed protein product [Linum tenue]|uniref:Uncharacterized protein n=1 Tax=Linum tenue TaxID=586396 RepID=A0AAV0Q9E0_9ROSI|nr:unnamed protein product [Linum tenue]
MNMISPHTLGRKSYARFKEEVDKVKEKMQTESSTPHDCSGPNDILSQVLEDKPYYSIAYGLGPKWGVRDSRYSIMKKALKAKNNAEERAQRVEDKLNKVLALLQKNNPNMNLNDNIDSPNDENDNLIVEENSDELGSGPILPMLQSSTVVPETPALDDVSMVDVYLPMLRNNSSKGGSSGVEANDVQARGNNDTFFDYMISSYQVKKTGVVKPLW